MKLKLKNPLANLNVKQQMILLFIVMVIPLFILNAYGNYKADQVLKRNVTNAYIELNKQNFRLITRDIEAINKVTSTVFQHPLLQQLNPSGESSETVLDRVKNYERLENLLLNYSQETDQREPVYYSLYVYDPDNAYFFAPYYPDARKAGVYFFLENEKPEWFDEAVAQKGNGYLRLIEHLSPSGQGLPNQKTLAYIRAINSIYKNGTIGVLVVSNVDGRIGESLQTVSIPEGELYFTDWNNRILTSTPNLSSTPTGSILDLPPEADLGDSLIGVKDVITEDFIYVINYNYVLQQKLVYKVPIKAMLQQQNEIKRIIQLISIAYFVVGLVLILYFWRSLMTPIQKLVYFVRRYEPGNVVPETPYRERNDEVSVLISTIYEMARRLNGLIHYKYQMDIKQKEAQLQILYQQINPHLLYNTLESIYWKSAMEGNTASAEMIKELSKLMKISLSRGRELITLEEELEHASAYIKLQEHRYEYGFRVIWDIPSELHSTIIPKITLQPLIENAIIHGVKHMGEDGEIMIRAEADEAQGCVYIRIADNGYKPVDFDAIDKLLNDETPSPSFGYGIRNIHQRLRLHFGPEYGLKYMGRPEGGTIVTITLPLTVNRNE
ncbi:histidine kinase [Paenibacillus sp. p3-SID1389]|uniref:sensor histidine kinase n=1 Tax=Paenibacillus sp. p3-SID1389 TaxID=2916364 RepID=UPI0021A7849E|nr:histidine kinase [Paenibacillus sp. p3-SID1389]MCT2196325.1 histidine kinase [Paenibacillus sp. p3-SID1389]